MEYFSSDIISMVGFYGVLFLLLLSLSGFYIAPYSINQQFLGYQLLPPSWLHDGNVAFLGTDDLGRDILSRLILGTNSTFGAALLVTFISTIIGFVLGSFAGMTQGLKSVIFNHILDIFLSIPSFVLAIIVVVFMGKGLHNAMFAICLSMIPRILRIIYIAIHNELNKEYIVSERLDGVSNIFILWYTVFPNIILIFIAELTRSLSIAILDIATFFIRMGVNVR